MGLFSKKEKKIDIENIKESQFELEDVFLIPVSEVPEQSKQSMALSIEKTRKFLESQGLEELKWPVVFEDGKKTLVNIHLPLKCEGESILWYRKKEDGLINKSLRAYEVVTEYRCYFYDLKEQVHASIGISPDIDVIVTNQKRISESQREGSFAGIGSRGTFVGSSGGISVGESQTFGDVNIMDGGEISFIFYDVADPNGLARLIKYAIKKIKVLWEKDAKIIEKKELHTGVACEKCNVTNPPDSKFCNGCGNKFSTICTKCKNVNPADSSFCNQCGFALQ